MKTYAAYFDNKIRMESSSGGIFSLCAKKFDVIYGVEMDSTNQYAVFSRKTDDISSLRGSKYIQAKVGDSFINVRNDLHAGRNVLFTGTACQVNGLYMFLQKDYPNLFTIDVICHGAPTPKYWQNFIEGKQIERVNFRAKDGGWQNYTYGMKLNNSYIPYYKNKFMSLYIRDYANRPSCYNCVCKKNKKSDITLGDFWGIEKIASSVSDNRGTSVVFVRTEKGQKLFEALKDEMVWKEVSYEEGVRQNPSEYLSADKPSDRVEFFEDMEKMNFEELYQKYCTTPSLLSTIKLRVKNFIRKIIF